MDIAQLPKLGITGIGSLPSQGIPAALDEVFSWDIPYLPTFPGQESSETMLVQGLEGIPGMKVKGEGQVQFDPEAWTPWEQDSNQGPLEVGLPTAWSEFLHRIPQMKSNWVKVQWIGPLTLAMVLEGVDFTNPTEGAAVFRQVSKHLASQARALWAPLLALGKQVLFFWDEPVLLSWDPENQWHRMAWSILERLLVQGRKDGVVLGVHCCGQGDPTGLIHLPLQIISIDASLSLGPLLRDPARLGTWIKTGGTLALGAVPTLLPQAWDPESEAQDLKEKFRKAFGDSWQNILENCLLTPACGLGLRTLEESRQVWEGLKTLQAELLSTG